MIDSIRDAVEEKTKKNVRSKIFHATVNQETIVKWRNELSRFMFLFNTQLNISANLKLNELLATFQHFCTTVTSNQPANVQAPDELPARPRVFFGRDDLVHDVVQHLLECRDVALIGTGGMGKSCIACAVLNDDYLIVKFQKHRFFIHFDDMDPAQITFATFLDRIARALGFKTSVNTHNLITKALSASDTLLVLDNAETFLDAAVDAGRIADAIDGFGARANVAILLTTRINVLPPNLIWIRLQVPGLGETAACDAFTTFYTPSIERSDLVKLLSIVDFHPLSINLLAQAAVQNQWSSKDLIHAWDRQYERSAESGDNKLNSVSVSIEISLNSPSIIRLGTTLTQLLQIITFLPQGRYKESLAHNPLLKQVQLYYKAHIEDRSIVLLDDINIEHVLTLWVKDSDYTSSVLELISDFFLTLHNYRPRPVAIHHVILKLDPGKSTGSVSCMDFLRAFPNPQRCDALVNKGMCLFAMSMLMRWTEQSSEADRALEEARVVCLQARRVGRGYLSVIDWGLGMVYLEQGNYMAAEELCRSALKLCPAMYTFKRATEVFIKASLSKVDTLRGKSTTSKECREAITILKKIQIPRLLLRCCCTAGIVELNEGHLDLAEKYFLKAQTVDGEDIEFSTKALMWLGEVTDRRFEYTKSMALRALAFEVLQKTTYHTEACAINLISIIAGYLAMEGNVERARELVIPAVANTAKHFSGKVVKASYMAGCIEMLGGDFDAAASYFQQNIDGCISVSELAFRARSERALGEIAVVRKDFSAARAHFEATSELCKLMGVPKDCMYREFRCYQLSETFYGWKLYQEDHEHKGETPY
ncbi:hypothetical protein DXG01_012476 [Tephrocybe rancida]|nr:hypothetical protein DXG01_012476 [Tephrocybe rancida]